MSLRPPGSSKEYFLGVLDHMLAMDLPGARRLWVADRATSPQQPRGSLQCHVDLRLHVLLEGKHRIAGHFNGEYGEPVIAPGDVFLFPPYALTGEIWNSPCLYAGLIFRPSLVRHLVCDFDGGAAPRQITPWAFHSRAAIGGAGRAVVAAINLLAADSPPGKGTPDEQIVRPLISSLLRLAREHLRQDEAPARPATRSYRSWQHVVEMINSQYRENIGRESIAKSLDLHPNYVTALCTRYSKKSFHDLLESTRIERAKHLLEQTDWKLEHVARECGFSGASYFIKAFRRVVGRTPGEWRR